MVPPLVLDIDGTMTRADQSIDPRICDPIRDWDAPVVIATGKSFPYPVALCTFVGIETNVIAENGGVVFVDDELTYNGDREAAQSAVAEFLERGHDLGWGDVDLANRWRETEVAVSLDAPEEPLREVAAKYGLEVVDTGYAYHVKSPDMSKGEGLLTAADLLGLDPSEFVAIGDSENDVSTFEITGASYAVANADEKAKRAADVVTDGSYTDGLLEALVDIRATGGNPASPPGNGP